MSTAQNRRRRFFIDKPLQVRYMLVVALPLLTITLVAIFGFYIAIWGRVLESFSNEQTRNDMLTAARMVQYDEARHQRLAEPKFSSLSFFKETEKLSARQREVFKTLLDETNRSLLWKLAILFALVAWGTIYASHKIAGPLYRFSKAFDEIENGNYRERIYLRKRDEGHPVAKECNEAIEATDKLLSDIKKKASDPDTVQAVAQIKEKLSGIKTSTDV